MKKIVLIPDSFKGTMSSAEICSVMKKAIASVYPDAQVVSIPVADGGEGTVDAFLSSAGGEKHETVVTGPFPGEKTKGYYALLKGERAVTEIASTASLSMVEGRKNPLLTTSYGTGEIIKEAVEKGAKKIILALGGSCTNDGGAGIAASLGVKFYDKKGDSFIPTGGTLKDIAFIETDNIIKNLDITVMCDIDNPFYGEEGASYIYGPQKGATESMVRELDSGMRHFASLIKDKTGVDVQEIKGSGAAGGIAGGVAALLKADLKMGIEVVLDTVDFDSVIQGASLVITGEGKIDSQTLRGKVVLGVAARARKQNVRVIAVVGDIAEEAAELYERGVDGIFSTNLLAVPYERARVTAEKDLYFTTANIMRYTKSLVG